MGHQSRSRAHARRSGRSFTAGMATPDNNDIETRVHWFSPQCADLDNTDSVVKTRYAAHVFHVKHAMAIVNDLFAVNDLFTNTKISENHVENFLDVHAAGQPAERRRGLNENPPRSVPRFLRSRAPMLDRARQPSPPAHGDDAPE